MARRRSRRQKDYTPPPDLAHDGNGQIEIPARTAVIVCKLLEQELNIPIPCSLVEKFSGILLQRYSGCLLPPVFAVDPRLLYSFPYLRIPY